MGRGTVIAIALIVGCLALFLESVGGEIDRWHRIAQACGLAAADGPLSGGPLLRSHDVVDDASDDAFDSVDDFQIARL